jgi:hypothetical protein
MLDLSLGRGLAMNGKRARGGLTPREFLAMERRLFGIPPKAGQAEARAAREREKQRDARERRIRRLWRKGLRVCQIARLVQVGRGVVGRVLGTRAT